MHPAFILLIVLCFPAVEVYLLLRWLESAPAFALTWFVCATLLGLYLLRRARAGFSALATRLRDGGAPLGAFFAFGKMWLAGALLVFPGVISDMLALVVVLLPGKLFNNNDNKNEYKNGGASPRQPRVIEGEYSDDG